jgi:endonuclease-3
MGAAMLNEDGKPVVSLVAKRDRRAPVPPKKQKERALRILDALCARFPDAQCELLHDPADPWQLLVAVVLSAQATDVSVNKVTPALFAAFSRVQAFAAAQPEDIEPYIKSIGLFRNKAKNIVAAARVIVHEFGGQVPSSRELLEMLPGVGSKSAAVIVANCFGEPAIAVDTHVGRVARRMGLTKETDPDRVEAALTALWPRERLLQAHHTLIFQGRRICDARKPRCSQCPVAAECRRVGVLESA